MSKKEKRKGKRPYLSLHENGLIFSLQKRKNLSTHLNWRLNSALLLTVSQGDSILGMLGASSVPHDLCCAFYRNSSILPIQHSCHFFVKFSVSERTLLLLGPKLQHGNAGRHWSWTRFYWNPPLELDMFIGEGGQNGAY